MNLLRADGVKMQARNKVNYVSLDYDGCLKNPAYANALDAANKSRGPCKSPKYDIVPDAAILISHNAVLLDAIRRDRQTNSYQSVHVMVGSNRQDISTDKGNRDGVSFPGIKAIAEHLNVEFDDFLLTDAFNNHPAGTTMAVALPFYQHYSSLRAVAEGQAKERNTLDERTGLHRINNAHYQVEERYGKDKTKISLVYAQMHRAASEHPDDEIVFDFYDDLDEEILNPIHQFYSANPDLMPKNLTLRLHQYNGAHIQLKNEIQGQGIIDVDYNVSTRFMYECGAGVSFAVLEANRKMGRDLEVAPNIGAALLEEDKIKLNRFRDGRKSQLAALEQDIRKVEADPSKADFAASLKKLWGDLDERITRKLESLFLAEDIKVAEMITVETRQLLADLDQLGDDNAKKLERINVYEERCNQVPGWTTLKKSIALVVTAAISMVVGAIVGFLAGMIAGSCFGPPAMFSIAALGAAAGAGAGLTLGISAGAPILFKPSKAQKDARELSENLRRGL